MKYVLLLLSMTMAVTGQLLFKRGLSSATLVPTIGSVLQTIFIPTVFLGFFIYGMSSIVWLFVLQKLPLSVAYPSLALTYVIVVMASFVLFKEPLTVDKIVGVLLISIGVFFINK